MTNNSSSSSSGIGFFGLLTIVFIVLKLTGYSVVATWSWWLVLLPLYAPLALVLVGFLVYWLIRAFI